jgi:hypothetical protein
MILIYKTKMSNSGYTRGDDSTSMMAPTKSSRDSIDKEVSSLFKHGNLNDYKVLNKLRSKYKDEDMVNSVFDSYKDKLAFLTKKAQKFKQAILDRYSGRNLSSNEFLMKAKKYKTKLGLTDDEFDMFFRLLHSEKNPLSNIYSMPSTKMNRTLGYSHSAMIPADKLNVSAKEEVVVQDILKKEAETRTLHSHVVLQSLTYKDCGIEALNGKFDKMKNNSFAYVHPVVAALFLPKIQLLDEHMLIANLGYIIKCKHENTPIMTKPDFELYNDLLKDPNDGACNIESAIVDISRRYDLQTKLWDNVLNLRQGRYYHDKPTDFLMAVDACRTNVYDAPDMAYVKDEGTILRRLLAAFSIRPTMITTQRLTGMSGSNTFNLSQNATMMQGITSMTTVPMITLRLPLGLSNPYTGTAIASSNPNNAPSTHLQEALTQKQWFVENKMIVPKSQQIIHSNNVLFFYVNRRYQHINIASMSNSPCNFTALPMTVSGIEMINGVNVNFDEEMNIANDRFRLRSVVIVNTCSFKRSVITGCSTMIVAYKDNESCRTETEYYLYDPQGASEVMFTKDANDKYTEVTNAPITLIPHTTRYNISEDEADDSFYCNAAGKGTLFMYEKINEAVC